MKKVSLFAAIAALLCGTLVYLYMNTYESRLQQAQKQNEIVTGAVVVAAQDIPPYTTITEDMLTFINFPADYIPVNAIRESSEVLGLQSDGTIYTGEMIFSQSVAPQEEIGSSLSRRIPDGMLAMTLNVSTAAGVGGFIVEGDCVDILQFIPTEESDQILIGEDAETESAPPVWIANPEEKTEDEPGRHVSGGLFRAVIQNALVLTTGTSYYSSDSGTLYDCVTLCLTPEQVGQFTSAVSEDGNLLLALRQRDDATIYDYGVSYFSDYVNQGEDA